MSNEKTELMADVLARFADYFSEQGMTAHAKALWIIAEDLYSK